MTEAQLKPCPFCGAELDYAEPVTYVHAIGKCILSGRNFKAGYIGQWNRRTPDHAQIRADALREALAALGDAGYGSSVAARVILALIDAPLSPTSVDNSPALDAGGTP